MAHADQQVLEQGLDFLGLLVQKLDVVGRVVHVEKLHPPFNAAQQRALLVPPEIVPRAPIQLPANRLQVRHDRCTTTLRIFLPGNPQLPNMGKQLRWNLGGGQNVIHQSGLDGGPRHAVLAVRRRRLGDRKPTVLPDGTQSGNPVASFARQNHRQCVFTQLGRQRTEEPIHGRRRISGLDRIVCPESSMLDRHRHTGWDHVDVVGFDPDVGRRQPDRHRRTSPQQLHQQVGASPLEREQDHDRHAAVGRHTRQDCLQGLHPSRRRPHRGDDAALHCCGMIRSIPSRLLLIHRLRLPLACR